jgi:hypothetical protein
LGQNFPHNSPYAFSENRVLDRLELEGLETVPLTAIYGGNSTQLAIINAEAGMAHEALDLLGFVPVVGEAADGLNALLYELEGDHLNAAFSAISLAPVAGDAAAKGFKYTLRYADEVANLSSKSAGRNFKSLDAATKWVNNAMEYGIKSADAISNRATLRNALKIAKGVTDEAHHIIPVNLIKTNANVRKAIDEGFDFNGAMNGIALPTSRHNGSHNKYDAAVNDLINEAFANKANAGKSAKEILEGVTNGLKSTLQKGTKTVNEKFN